MKGKSDLEFKIEQTEPLPGELDPYVRTYTPFWVYCPLCGSKKPEDNMHRPWTHLCCRLEEPLDFGAGAVIMLEEKDAQIDKITDALLDALRDRNHWRDLYLKAKNEKPS